MGDREALLARCTVVGGKVLVDGRAPTGDEMLVLLDVPDETVSAVVDKYAAAHPNGHGHKEHDLRELHDLLAALTGRDGDVHELVEAAVEIDPVELDHRIGELDLDSQDALAELIDAFPRVAGDLPELRMLANRLHGDDCPCFAEATARHIERMLLIRAARSDAEHPLPDDALAWLEDRAIRF